MKKFILKILFAVFFVLLMSTHHVDASFSILKVSEENISIGEQFYVDIMINTENESINGVEGSVTFDDKNLTLIRAEEGKSFITFWIEKAVLNNNKISFAGIVPTGFSGLIDPFNSSNKAPGTLIRLVFEGKSSGNTAINISPLSLTLNDGEGSIIYTAGNSTYIFIDKSENRVVYESKDDSAPTIDAYVTQDENLFNNKYTLVFRVNDKETGVDTVMVKEGNKDWKEIESPYLLEDQSGRSIINIRAINFSGESSTLTIEPTKKKGFSAYNYIIFLVVIIILLVLKFKKYVFKKQK